jgi:hypothetical protein
MEREEEDGFFFWGRWVGEEKEKKRKRTLKV